MGHRRPPAQARRDRRRDVAARARGARRPARVRRRCEAGSKELAVATKTYEKNVQGNERAFASAQKFGQRRLGSYHGKDGTLTLYEDRITYDSRSFRLDPSFRVSADTAGNLVAKSRSTLTRMATGGLLLGPVGLVAGAAARKTKVQDARELYLLVESDEFSAAVTCKAEDGAKVRQFAALIMTTARQAANVAEQREHAITVARQTLEWARQETGDRDAAAAALTAAQGNIVRLQRTQLALEAAPRSPEP